MERRPIGACPRIWRGSGRSAGRPAVVVIAALAAVVGLLGSVRSAWAGSATDAVKSTIDEVLRILRDKDLKKPERAEERRHLLEKVIGDRFDYEEMSKRALGAPWHQLDERERQEFVQLFRTLLTNSYADKIESYSGEPVQYMNERTEKDFAEVRTKVVSGKAEIPLDYRLLNSNGEWRVYDVVIDGVSLVKNYRAQFTEIIRSSSYAGLVEQLRRKSDKIKAP